MTRNEHRAEVVRLYFVEKWRKGTIARELGLHHSTISRILERAEKERAGAAGQSAAASPKGKVRRGSMADPYLPLLRLLLDQHPQITASRLYQMIKERGYPGGPDHVRAVVRSIRPPREKEAFLRLSALPGEEAQVDWAQFGWIQIGKARRRLSAFLMVLSYSRRLFVRFYPSEKSSFFLRGHIAAFAAFGGVPRRILYDNLKSAVLHRQGDAIQFNPRLYDFSAYYRFEPRPVGVRRGNEKGRVERAVRYLRDAFFAALEWTTLEELNEKVTAFCDGQAMQRRFPDDQRLSVADAFAEEQRSLIALPEAPFVVVDRVEVSIGKTPYARFDGNDYSVPFELVGRTLTVVATTKTVRVLDGSIEVARHQRSFARSERIENPNHLRELVQMKRRAHKGRMLDQLSRATPSAIDFLRGVADARGNVGSSTKLLGVLLESYGARRLEAGLLVAIERGVFYAHAVRQAIERQIEDERRSPSLPIALPDDPRVHLNVRPHDLQQYDERTIHDDEEDGHEELDQGEEDSARAKGE